MTDEAVDISDQTTDKSDPAPDGSAPAADESHEALVESNESPVELLRNVEAFSDPVRVGPGRAMPALSVKKFRFSSVSKAV